MPGTPASSRGIGAVEVSGVPPAAGDVLTADTPAYASWQAGGGGITLADVYPVGSVYLSVVATNPATLFGFGTWARIGQGRALVGQDAGDPDFDTAEETGGAKTVTLATAEIPSHSHSVTDPQHTHVQNAHTHVQDAHGHGLTDPGHTHLTQRYPTATGGSSGFTIDTSMSGALADNTLPVKSNTTGVTVQNTTPTNQNATPTNQGAATGVTVDSAGGGGAHANLQPYVVVYVWKRTA
jgi:microcystin-dependent protein